MSCRPERFACGLSVSFNDWERATTHGLFGGLYIVPSLFILISRRLLAMNLYPFALC